MAVEDDPTLSTLSLQHSLEVGVKLDLQYANA